MLNIDQALGKYITDHIQPEGKLLEELSRQTHLKTPYPNMISGHLQGKILEFISKMIRPKRILEIGTFTGYSAICLAKGLAEGGELHTIESNDELREMANHFIQESGLKEKITQITGNALEKMKQLEGPYDLIFIDGEKSQYTEYYKLAVNVLKSGGFIIADNVLWSGKVVDKGEKNDPATKGIMKFNQMVLKDKRVENIIIPVRDGLSLIRKL